MQRNNCPSYTIRHHPNDILRATVLYYAAENEAAGSKKVDDSVAELNPNLKYHRIKSSLLARTDKLYEMLCEDSSNDMSYCPPLTVINRHTRARGSLDLILAERRANSEPRLFGVSVAHTFISKKQNEGLCLLVEAKEVDMFELMLSQCVKNPMGLNSEGASREVNPKVRNGFSSEEVAKTKRDRLNSYSTNDLDGSEAVKDVETTRENGTNQDEVVGAQKDIWTLNDHIKGDISQGAAPPLVDFRHVYTKHTPEEDKDSRSLYKDVALFEIDQRDTKRLMTVMGNLSKFQAFFSTEMFRKPGVRTSKVHGIIRIGQEVTARQLRRLFTPRKNKSPIRIVIGQTVGHINSFHPLKDIPGLFTEGASIYIQTERAYVFGYYYFLSLHKLNPDWSDTSKPVVKGTRKTQMYSITN